MALNSATVVILSCEKMMTAPFPFLARTRFDCPRFIRIRLTRVSSVARKRFHVHTCVWTVTHNAIILLRPNQDSGSISGSQIYILSAVQAVQGIALFLK